MRNIAMSESFQEFCKRILPVVQAGAEGKKIEFLGDDGESWIKKDTLGFVGCCEYRIAEPKATPLPITPEMWAMIDPKYRFACMDDHGAVCFSHVELEWRGHYWADFSSPVGGRCKSPLNIDTTGIIPELSLTKRPDVVSGMEDSGSSKEEIKEWLVQEVKGGVFDPDLTKRTIDKAIKKSDNPAETDYDEQIKLLLKSGIAFNRASCFEKEHINPATGEVQIIRVKMK